MKIDGFLKVPDIEGPSERADHEGEIECHGMDFTMEAPHDPNSLSRRGRVNLGIFWVTKYYDKASPYLKAALFKNTPLDEVQFAARRTIAGETSDYLVVKMKDASVVQYKVEPAEDEADLLEEKVGFAYKSVEFTYDGDHIVEMDVHVGK